MRSMLPRPGDLGVTLGPMEIILQDGLEMELQLPLPGEGLLAVGQEAHKEPRKQQCPPKSKVGDVSRS